MRAIVIGAGSIGTRHAAVLTTLGLDVGFVSSRHDLAEPVFTTIEDAVDRFGPGYVVVANETARHSPAIGGLAASGYRGAVLIEKPMAVSAAEIDAVGFSRVGVGFNLRFHPVIVAMREALGSAGALTVEVYAGQALSTWRPGRELGDQYSTESSRGGGVLRDLSHEFDYLQQLLGACLGLFARGGRLGTVTRDSDDAWGIVASYERSPVVTLQLNYFDTVTRRRIVANTGTATIEADLVASTLSIDGVTETFATDRDASYSALHRAMLADGYGVATTSEAGITDDTVLMVERSALAQQWVTR